MHNLIQIIKKAAIDAVEASKPVNFLSGTVVTDSPLSIRIDQKLILPEDFLILTKNVLDYDVEMEVEHTTEISGSHSHEYKGKKLFRVHNALKVGDMVILLRVQNGQKYIVLDKILQEVDK